MNDRILSPHTLYDTRIESERVLRLQRMLRILSQDTGDLLLNTTETGVYDPPTVEAVRSFQRKYSLPVTGETDLATWTRLRELQPALTVTSPTIRPFFPPEREILPGEFSDYALLLQILLNTLLLYYDSIDPLPLSAHYDAASEKAVREFQRINGLEVTGKADRILWERLCSEYNRIAPENQ